MSEQMRFRLLISYKGLDLYGWQKQKNLPTVQGFIEQALKKLFQKDISVIGAGRTDKGAHALGQTAHFDLSFCPLPGLQKALNSFLIPKNICIRGLWKAPKNFHALRSAQGKHYIYRFLNRPLPCVFRKGLIYWHPHPVNLSLLQKMSRKIQGRHNFKSFQNAGTPLKNTIRTITRACWRREGKDILSFHIEGEGFLKQMIRNLAGAQLKLLKEKDPLKKWDEIRLAKDRKTGYETLSAEGLYLYKVSYPAELDRECQKL